VTINELINHLNRFQRAPHDLSPRSEVTFNLVARGRIALEVNNVPVLLTEDGGVEIFVAEDYQ